MPTDHTLSQACQTGLNALEQLVSDLHDRPDYAQSGLFREAVDTLNRFKLELLTLKVSGPSLGDHIDAIRRTVDTKLATSIARVSNENEKAAKAGQLGVGRTITPAMARAHNRNLEAFQSAIDQLVEIVRTRVPKLVSLRITGATRAKSGIWYHTFDLSQWVRVQAVTDPPSPSARKHIFWHGGEADPSGHPDLRAVPLRQVTPGQPPEQNWLSRRVNRVGPLFLIREMFGLLNEKSRNVNLSDGGHIENLGVYELLRRECRLIIASDAECDPDYQFQGLANVIRLARIDMGTRITMAGLDRIRQGRQNHAIGTIEYRGGKTGRLIYLKSSLPTKEKIPVTHRVGHSTGILYENGVNTQQQLGIAAQAATNQGVIQIYSVNTMAGATAASKIANSDTPDTLMSLITALKGVQGVS